VKPAREVESLGGYFSSLMDGRVNAVISDKTRESIYSMALSHQVPVHRIVTMLIEYGLQRMTTGEIRSRLTKAAKKSDKKPYRRTKAF
jgi:hypothetical protein